MRIVFDTDEQQALRADARDHALTDPGVAYVLERLASEGVNLDACTDWDDLKADLGRGPRSTGSAA
ncbi:hypothetical protein RCO28_27425 [Streptomyces sp. LHD-70]|uniref:hypothetical protein n=1 Tax=Streptomyces sp. LHD-70 TaxID=3072140 RepID=UPI00280E3BF8|nr:hypothetical protein [Streptomyces sp. LHD-70]MDQ8706171.1 hypothetical protein [Streptomyces sp. LHD-70]